MRLIQRTHTDHALTDPAVYRTVSEECRQLVVDTVDICLEEWLDQRAMGAVVEDSDPAIKR